MPDFTPGPWKHELIHGVIDIFPASNTDNDIVSIYDLSEEGEANARLIAAAPDMYDLLGKAFDALPNDHPLRYDIDACLCHVEGTPVPGEDY